jgi:signal transduction histidine kinase
MDLGHRPRLFNRRRIHRSHVLNRTRRGGKRPACGSISAGRDGGRPAGCRRRPRPCDSVLRLLRHRVSDPTKRPRIPLGASEGEGRGSRHLLQLINDVLDLAKVEAGKIDLNPETFPLAKAIKEVCTVVKGIAQKKGVSVKWVVAPELGNVTLDQQKFKQVCYNLLANAVKFTDSSGSVELNALAHDDERFELRVKDTGIGIKKEDMQRLFREFEQLESGNARRFEGTVLGLALTKKLVESQGGSIGAESEYGKGSTFFVVMPIVFADVKSHE